MRMRPIVTIITFGLLLAAIGGFIIADQINLDPGPFVPSPHEPYTPSTRAPEIATLPPTLHNNNP